MAIPNTMTVFQSKDLLNKALELTLGEGNVVNQDLSNFVQMGDTVFNTGRQQLFAQNLIDVVGKDRYNMRKYTAIAPSLLKIGGEYGSIFRKFSFELPDDQDNATYQLRDGLSVDPNIFKEVKANVKYFNGKQTHEVQLSITYEMLKQAFHSPAEMDAFIAGLFNIVYNRQAKDLENSIMFTIDNLIAETVNDNGADRVVHLLTEYNAIAATPISDEEMAFRTPEFIRYFCERLALTKSRMRRYSVNFNIGGKQRFTPEEDQRLILLDIAKVGTDIYLQSGTFHNELTKLPENLETVPYWQGQGSGSDAWTLDEISAINITTQAGHTVNKKYIVGILYDNEAMGVGYENERTTTNPNGRGEFTNYWFKADCMYFNDTDENAVVFVLD